MRRWRRAAARRTARRLRRRRGTEPEWRSWVGKRSSLPNLLMLRLESGRDFPTFARTDRTARLETDDRPRWTQASSRRADDRVLRPRPDRRLGPDTDRLDRGADRRGRRRSARVRPAGARRAGARRARAAAAAPGVGRLVADREPDRRTATARTRRRRRRRA